MRFAPVLLLCPSLWAASYTCTSAASGNWNAAATWTNCNGTYPDNIQNGGADTYAVTIAAHTVTIPEGVSVSVGTGSGNAILLNNAASRLVQNGNLTVNAHIAMSANGARFEPTAIQSSPVLTLVSSGTINPVVKVTGGAAAVFAPTGTAANWVRIVGDQSGGGYAQIDGLGLQAAAPWVFQYTQLESMGKGSLGTAGSAIYRIEQIDADHLRLLNSSQLRVNCTTATSTCRLNRVDIRAGANSDANYLLYVYAVTYTAKTGGYREITDSTFVGSVYTQGVYVGPADFTLARNVYHTTQLQLSSTNSLRGRVSDSAFVGPCDSSSITGVPGNGDLRVSNTAFLEYSANVNGSNGHVVAIPNTGDRAIGPNVWDGIVRDSGGSMLDAHGDFVMSAYGVVIRNSLFAGYAGNIADGLYSSAVQSIEHTTSYGISDQTGYGAVVLSEAGDAATKNTNIRSNLFVNEPNGVIQGGATWLEQNETFVLDYNASYGITDALSVYHPSGWRSHLRAPTVTRKSATATIAGTNATTVVFAGTSLGVLVGDYAGVGSNRAAITSVTEGGGNTTLALGLGTAATPGIAGLANPTQVTVYKRYWASGGIYGDANKGQHDIVADPRFAAPGRAVNTWDERNGGPGNAAHAADEMVKLNGLDKSGGAAQFNTAYSPAGYLEYVRRGMTPQNPALYGKAHDGTWPGAVQGSLMETMGLAWMQ